MKNTPVLEVRNLCKTFTPAGRPPVRAARDISLRLYPGEILGIVGGSGSGKSTLARLITRLIEPTSGKIILDGEDITQLKPKDLKSAYAKIQMVFQAPVGSFDPRRTLGDGIGESLRNRRVSKTEIARKTALLLEQCGMDASFAKRYPHEVSGGECQRAAIARALAIDPKVLICDEATSGLDVTVQKQVISLLLSLRDQEGMAYLFICHNFALVQELCDRVLVMRDGRVVEEGAPDEVIFTPRNEYTRMLIDSIL